MLILGLSRLVDFDWLMLAYAVRFMPFWLISLNGESDCGFSDVVALNR